MPSTQDLLHVAREIGRRRTASDSLGQIAARAGWSPFHFHRAFRATVRETPKQYALRLRLEHAALRLVSSRDSVLAVALESGFNSHAVFTRAFRRHFGLTPAHYRDGAMPGASPETRARHEAIVRAAGPCRGLFHVVASARSSSMPTLSIERRDVAPQHILFVRLRVARTEIANAIAEGLGKAFPYALRAGYAIAGRPFTRYLSTGPGLYSIEVGMPVAASGTGEGDVEAGTIPGGPVAMAVHAGPYDQLSETYAALERWIEQQGFRVGGPPWESYITDPAELPDAADWRTEVYWPLGD